MKIFCGVLCSIFFILSSLANAFDCTSGNLTQRTAKFKDIVQTFSFSEDCLLQNDKEKVLVMKGAGYVNLEVYWPNFLSHRTFKKLSDESQSSGINKDSYIRAFITLSYGPTPLMISSTVDAYHSEKSHQLVREDKNYSYFIRRPKFEDKESRSSNNTLYITPKFRKDFWVSCMKKQCFLTGIEEKVRYEVNLQSGENLNWNDFHESMILFIREIYVGTN